MCEILLQLHELARLGSALDGIERAQRLDIIGRRHDGRLLAAHDAHEVLELHLVRKCRVNGGLLDVGGLDHEAREREQARGKPEGGRARTARVAQ